MRQSSLQRQQYYSIRYSFKPCSSEIAFAKPEGVCGNTHLEAEEVCDGTDVVREYELAEPHYPGVVSPAVEVELAQQLPSLECVFES